MPRIATTNPTIAPEWNRASRYGAVLVIIVCTVIALRPLMTSKAIGHARPVTPATTHHLLRAACASALKGHFVFNQRRHVEHERRGNLHPPEGSPAEHLTSRLDPPPKIWPYRRWVQVREDRLGRAAPKDVPDRDRETPWAARLWGKPRPGR